MLLAQSSQFTPSLPAGWPRQMDLISWCQNMDPAAAMLLLLAGAVYLLFGWYLFKTLVMVNAVALGGYLGAVIGAKAGSVMAGAVIGAVIAGAVSWPLMKWAVAVMGGLCGAALGAAIWAASGQDMHYAWAGAMTGLVGFGMLSFIVFRGSIIMYTSLQGATMVVLGLLGVLFRYSIAPSLASSLTSHSFLLPMTVLLPAVAGLIYQHRSTPAQDAGGEEKAG